MPSLEDFLTKLDENPIAAFTEYNFLVDEESLDYVPGQLGVRDEFKRVDVALDYGAQTVTIRAAKDSDAMANSMSIWFLPWKHFDGAVETSGVAQAVLDGKGPGIFLTSRLDGCRFTIQYQTGDMKKASVLHLAGNYGQDRNGAIAREKVENTTLENVPKGADRRRYSIGQYSKNPKYMPLPVDGVRSYYDGGAATVLGVRGRDGAWKFFAQQYKNNAFLNVKEL